MEIGMGIYVKNSVEAVELYKEAFGLTLGYHVLNTDGTYYHSELYKGSKEMLSVVEAGEREPDDHIVQIGVTLDSEEEVKKAFDVLGKEGKVEMEICELPWSPCATVITDKFGVWWYVTAPQHRPPEDFDPSND